MSRTLLEISEDLAAIGDLMDAIVDMDTGEIDRTADGVLEEFFMELGEERDQKLDNYCALIRDFELRSAAFKEEAERLKRRADAAKSSALRLKSRLEFFFGQQGLAKVQTRRFTMAIQANGGKPPLEVTVPAATLPERYRIIEYRADKDAIRQAIEAGETVPGCLLLERGTHLRIR